MSSKGRAITMKNGLTLKQNAFKDKVIEQIATTGKPNGTQAALEVYDTDDRKTAKSIATENLTNPAIRNEIEQALTANGVTSEGIVKNIKGIAEHAPQKITGETVLKANLSLLKILGLDGSERKGKNSLTVNNTVINIGYDEAKQKLQQVSSDADRFIQEADIS